VQGSGFRIEGEGCRVQGLGGTVSLDEDEDDSDGGGEASSPWAAVGQNLLCRAARRDTRPFALRNGA
jgi:hypothetical protein